MGLVGLIFICFIGAFIGAIVGCVMGAITVPLRILDGNVISPLEIIGGIFNGPKDQI
jgi:hypothetical protein